MVEGGVIGFIFLEGGFHFQKPRNAAIGHQGNFMQPLNSGQDSEVDLAVMSCHEEEPIF